MNQPDDVLFAEQEQLVGQPVIENREDVFADPEVFFGEQERIHNAPESIVSLGPSSETEIKVEKVQHFWTVKNFSHCFVDSLENFIKFRQGEKQLVWSIQIFPRGSRDNNREFVFFCLNRVGEADAPDVKLGVRAQITVKNARNVEIGLRYHPTPLHSDFVFYVKRADFFPHILPDDLINLHVSMSIAIDTVTTVLEPGLFALADPASQMSDAYQRMFEEGLMSDFVIIVENRRIPTHRGVLAVRSPVFKAMLEHGETMEARTGQLKIEDMEHDVIAEMVRFMYCGRWQPNLCGMAANLLIASDKYRIDELKLHCEKVLAEGLTTENACTFLAMADLYTAPRLRLKAIQFILHHSKHVTNTEGWTDLIKNHTGLVTEIVSHLNDK